MARGSSSAPWRHALLALALTAAFAAPAAAAERTVTLENGETIQAERLYPTYTTLVILLEQTQMRLVPNDQVKSIDGVPFEQVYWGDAIYGGDTAAVDPAGEAAAGTTTAAAPAEGGLLPLAAGTARQYEVTGTRTTWIRNGRVMDRKPTEPLTGLIRQTVVGAAPEGPVAVRESVIERVGGGPAREAQILQLLERRDAGTFLVGYGAQQGGGAEASEPIGVPPQLWPSRLQVGQVWVVGPFERQNMYHVARMEVVAQEPVTVPAGTYPEAYRVLGFGHVWAGSQSLDVGRLVTDHGTIETTTWVVPGVGPVKEERKVHLHQGYFPAGQTGRETPFVVEEITTRSLNQFQAGQE